MSLIKSRSNRAKDAEIASKIGKGKKKPVTMNGLEVNLSGKGNLMDRINQIKATVGKYLGKYVHRYELIRNDINVLSRYIDKCIENGIIAIDTETTGLNILEVQVAGICLYTPGMKGVYIPLNHVSYVTQAKVDNQISIEECQAQLQRLIDANVKVIMFNAKFDLRVLKHHLHLDMICHWDCYIAAHLLNENEPSKSLKALHKKYCLDGKEDAFAFDSLFKGIPFTLIPLKTAYLYAARDPEITYELYEFQKPFLTPGDPKCVGQELEKTAQLFMDTEMAVLPVVAKMEDVGVALDMEYAKQLSDEYNAKLHEIEKKIAVILKEHEEAIDRYKRAHPECKLDNSINIGSPSQLEIVLYDIFKITPPKVKGKKGNMGKARSTGESVLLRIDHPLAKAVLEYRGVAKLVSTYIDKLPKEVNAKTGRIHASFNQCGTVTGRFSSNDPNLQNIPSHDTKIRKMFIPTPGYYMLSSDYSAQEPRLTAHLSGDEKMIQAYKDGKDLYAVIASLAFDVSYEECLEFLPDGKFSKEGKERRNTAKAIVLGINYGKGIPAIADDLRVTKEKAQQIYDKVMLEFPQLKKFMEDSQNMGYEKGYVTTVWGRKRRLPDMQLPTYEFSYKDGQPKDFDPLFDDPDEVGEVSEDLINYYWDELDKAYGRDAKQRIKNAALEEHNIVIKDNGGFIAEAKRQAVNARVQGSAADQSKKAMILVDGNKRLKELGFRLLLVVHDELIGECPIENVKEVKELLASSMVEAAKDLVVPSKCDVAVTDRWYGEEIEIA